MVGQHAWDILDLMCFATL